MNPPFCGSCGSPSRWLADQNAWGCDRCRQIVMYAQQAPPPQAPQYQPPPQPQAQPYMQQGFAPQQQQQAWAPHAHQPPQQQMPPPPSPYSPQAQQPQQPYSPYPPQPQPAQPAPASAKKSSKGLVIGLLALVVAGGAALAIVLVVRGHGGGSGAGSRDDVVKNTLAALAAGDTDALLALGDPASLFDLALDCSKEKPRKHDDDDDDGAKSQVAKAKLQLALAAAATKGSKIELVEIKSKQPPPLDEAATDDKHHDDDTIVFAKGKEVSPGCVAKQTFRIHEVRTKIRVEEPDRDAHSQTTRVSILETDGRFFLLEPPSIDLRDDFVRMLPVLRDQMCACTDAACAKRVDRAYRRGRDHADKVPKDDASKAIVKAYGECGKKVGIASGGDMDDAIAKLGEYADQMCTCKDKACGDKVQADMMKWAEQMGKDAGKDVKPDESQMKKAADVSKRLADCMMKLQTPTPTPTPTPVDPGGGSVGGAIAAAALDEPPPDMTADCAAYRTQIARAMTCDKYPASARDGLAQAWNALAKAWKDTPGAHQSLGDACAQGAKAMRDALNSICP